MGLFSRFNSSKNLKDKSLKSNVIGTSLKQDEKKCSFEEFKLYYESTEKVTDRRITNNNLSYSICIAVLLATGYIWNWSISNSTYTDIGLTLVCTLSVIAILYTRLWLAQIKDFKRLNAAKFDVLNEMAPNLAFNDQKSEVDIISYEPFRKEWEKIKGLNGLQKRRRFNIVALSSSNQEYFVPQAFTVIFALPLVSSIITILFHFNIFIDAWKHFLKI